MNSQYIYAKFATTTQVAFKFQISLIFTCNIGVEYYEKNVVNQLLEFMHYYTTEILQEADIFKQYARLSAN